MSEQIVHVPLRDPKEWMISEVRLFSDEAWKEHAEFGSYYFFSRIAESLNEGGIADSRMVFKVISEMADSGRYRDLLLDFFAGLDQNAQYSSQLSSAALELWKQSREG